MAKYKLLKDLPGLKKGTILSEGEPIFGVKTLITKNNDVGTTFIGNELFEELFEEIQEEPTDSIHWNPRIGDRCFILENANIKQHFTLEGYVIAMLGVLAKYSAPKKNAKKPVTVN